MKARGKRGRGQDHLCEVDQVVDPSLEPAADSQNLTQLQVGPVVESEGLLSHLPAAGGHEVATATPVHQPPVEDAHMSCKAIVEVQCGVGPPSQPLGEADLGTLPGPAGPTTGISTQDQRTISLSDPGQNPGAEQSEATPDSV